MKRNERLSKVEDLGFYIVMSFASVIGGFGILGLIAKLAIEISSLFKH